MLMMQIANGFVFNGQPISEEEKKLVHHWIADAASFHVLPKEEQDRQLGRDVSARRAESGGTCDLITAAAQWALIHYPPRLDQVT
jgi:hypothetical protein